MKTKKTKVIIELNLFIALVNPQFVNVISFSN